MKNGLLKKGILCTLTVLTFFSFAACSSKEKDKTPAKTTTAASKENNSNELSDGVKTELKTLIEASLKLQYNKTITIAPPELYTNTFLSTLRDDFYKEAAKPYKIVDITFKAKDKNSKADATATVKIEDKTETYSQQILFVKLNGTYYIDKILVDR